MSREVSHPKECIHLEAHTIEQTEEGRYRARMFTCIAFHVPFTLQIIIDTIRQLGDEWADTQMLVDGERDGCLGSFSRLKASHSHLKLILSIGGGAGSENFASVASDSTAVRRFVKSAKYLVMAHNLDGIDSMYRITGCSRVCRANLLTSGNV